MKGWFGESGRHALAAKGIKTGRKKNRKKGFFDRPAGEVYRALTRDIPEKYAKGAKSKGRYSADGRVFNVKEFYDEMGLDEEVVEATPEDWYEYEVWLIDKKTGDVVDEWSSLSETYLPGRELTEKRAEESLEEIMDDINVRGTPPSHWFSRVPEDD